MHRRDELAQERRGGRHLVCAITMHHCVGAGPVRRVLAHRDGRVVLGCTEIELLVSPGDSPLPLLDSMRTHAEAAAAAAVRAPADGVDEVVSPQPG